MAAGNGTMILPSAPGFKLAAKFVPTTWFPIAMLKVTRNELAASPASKSYAPMVILFAGPVLAWLKVGATQSVGRKSSSNQPQTAFGLVPPSLGSGKLIGAPKSTQRASVNFSSQV